MVTDSFLFWVNLIIVVLLLVKFAAKPLMDFLKSRNKNRSIELIRLESEKEKISGEIGKTMKIIDEKKAIIADAEKNISKCGEDLRAEIIREAEIESARILEKAKQGAEKDIKVATKRLRAEVVEKLLNKD